jgi:hypothetical protein
MTDRPQVNASEQPKCGAKLGQQHSCGLPPHVDRTHMAIGERGKVYTWLTPAPAPDAAPPENKPRWPDEVLCERHGIACCPAVECHAWYPDSLPAPPVTAAEEPPDTYPNPVERHLLNCGGCVEPPKWCREIAEALFEPPEQDGVARLVHAAYLLSDEARKVERLEKALRDAVETVASARVGNSFYGPTHVVHVGADQLDRWRAALAPEGEGKE